MRRAAAIVLVLALLLATPAVASAHVRAPSLLRAENVALHSDIVQVEHIYGVLATAPWREQIGLEREAEAMTYRACVLYTAMREHATRLYPTPRETRFAAVNC